MKRRNLYLGLGRGVKGGEKEESIFRTWEGMENLLNER